VKKVRLQKGATFLEFMVVVILGLVATASVVKAYNSMTSAADSSVAISQYVSEYYAFLNATTKHINNIGASGSDTIFVQDLITKELLPKGFPLVSPFDTEFRASIMADSTDTSIKSLVYDVKLDIDSSSHNETSFLSEKIRENLIAILELDDEIDTFTVGIVEDENILRMYGTSLSIAEFNLDLRLNGVASLVTSADSYGYIVISSGYNTKFVDDKNIYYPDNSLLSVTGHSTAGYDVRHQAVIANDFGFQESCPSGYEIIDVSNAETADIVRSDQNTSPLSHDETMSYALCFLISKVHYAELNNSSYEEVWLNSHETTHRHSQLYLDDTVTNNWGRNCLPDEFESRSGNPGVAMPPRDTYAYRKGISSTNDWNCTAADPSLYALSAFPNVVNEVDTLSFDSALVNFSSPPHVANIATIYSNSVRWGEYYVRAYSLYAALATGDSDGGVWDDALHQRSYYLKYEFRVSKNPIPDTTTVTVPYAANSSNMILNADWTIDL
jgi:hypothetical protein